jgi:hypothetical protein
MKTLLCSAIVAASLALTANAATAAGTKVHQPTTGHVTRPRNDYASGNYPPAYYASLNYIGGQLAQFTQSLANGAPMPYAQLQLARKVGRWRDAHHLGGTYVFSPYD